MREAVIVAARRTPIGKAYRGAFNNTYGATLGGHAIAAAIEQAGDRYAVHVLHDNEQLAAGAAEVVEDGYPRMAEPG